MDQEALMKLKIVGEKVQVLAGCGQVEHQLKGLLGKVHSGPIVSVSSCFCVS